MKSGNEGIDLKTHIQFITVFMTVLIFGSSLSLISDRTYHCHNFFHIADDLGPHYSNFEFPYSQSFDEYFQGSVEIDVIDEDGIDQVWCSYKKNGTSSWRNVSMTLTSNVTYFCYINGYLDSYTNVWLFQIHANDTTGFSTTSDIYSGEIYYDEGDGPIPEWIYLASIIAAGSIIILVLVAIGWWYRKRQ